MPKPNFKLYIIALFIILGILIFLVSLYSFRKQSKQKVQIQNLPTPTSVLLIPISKPSAKSVTIHIAPRFTGANEDIPQSTLSAAMEKQALKKKIPLTESGFVITYDYPSDNFVVTLSEPKQDNKQIFEQWLKQNYPLISISKFLFK